MAVTIEQQLANLDGLRRQLANNLTAMSVTASETATLAQLVPMVLDIPTGGEPGQTVEVTVDLSVYSAVDASGNETELSTTTVNLEELAAAYPNVVGIHEEKKVAISEIIAVTDPAERENLINTYFEKQGAEVYNAMQMAIAENGEVTSLADIEPMLVVPILVESPIFEEGKSVIATFNLPNEFSDYTLTTNSFICAEIIDPDGNTHIIVFKVTDTGKLEAEIPVSGWIDVFWFGSTATAPASPKDVNFYDYDGTLVYSYTLSEVRTLMSLPKAPDHDGLVFQGWNWSLENVKALTRPMNVGALYITDDGKTRLKIRVWDKARSNVPLYINQTVANGVTIDWGDGSPTETLDGTGNVNTSHQYTAAGIYTISLSVADGCTLGFSDTSSAQLCVMGNINNNAYCNLLQEVNIGSGVIKVSYCAFQECTSLTTITIPENVLIDARAFYGCFSLTSIVIPYGTKNIGSIMFAGCRALKIVSFPKSIITLITTTFEGCSSLASILLPDGVTSIGENVFRYCDCLVSITIPESVTIIKSGAFRYCYGIAEYHLKPTTPPTLDNANAFEGIPSDCIIYVPAGSLEAYKTAENWSTYADYMREEP